MENNIQAQVKVFLTRPGGRDEPFCGPGMVTLLQRIKDTGNVRKACEAMQMSYSKGWKLLRELEACLDYKVVARQQGGAGGGEAHLTPDGEQFLTTFVEFDAACREAVAGIFTRYYPLGVAGASSANGAS